MKFSKHLESQSVPEWRKAYINYKELKKELKQVEKVQQKKKKNCDTNSFSISKKVS